MSIQLTFNFVTIEDAQAFLQRSARNLETQDAAPVAAATVAVVEPETVAAEASASTETTEFLVSEAVKAFAHQNRVDLNSVTGSGKNGRITQADVKAAIKASPKSAGEAIDPFNEPDDSPFVDPFDAPPVQTVDDDPFGSNDVPITAKELTKEDARAALVEYQFKLKAKYLKDGKSDVEASAKAQEVTRDKLLKPYGETLGGLDPSKFGPLVANAKAHIAKLR